jgi:membrane associated rhomboid family serine protease
MIDAKCECGLGCAVAENAIATPLPPCPRCGRSVRFVSAEPLAQGQGAGDFDARLVFVGGPDRAGEQVLLGGCCEIEVGKLPERHLQVTGQKVSRLHCKLLRLDFGPSRWSLEDQRSTNGLFLNGQRVTEPVELRDGDVFQIGEYSLRYATDAARTAAASIMAASAPVKAIPVGGVNCPSCDRPTFDGALICTDCGIYIHSGRPLITARGVDQDRVDEVAREAIWLPSFLFLMGFLPVASEAFGTHKPRATWAIVAITVLCSMLFMPVACDKVDGTSPQVQNLMVWSGDRSKTAKEVQARLQELKEAEAEVDAVADRANDYYVRKFRRQVTAERNQLEPLLSPQVGFRAHALLTHALLHDGFLHLAGNLLFLLVFGLRVNELIGNTRTAILYPLFAAFSAAVHVWGSRHGDFRGLLGASGAISGLAGMYFILFPVQRVRMLAFLNLWLLTAFCCLTKPFWIRGFWLLLLWFLWGDVIPVVLGWEDGTAHWAHLGGFAAGMVSALGLLFTRQVYARGDILSVALGRRAWVFVGKPSRYMQARDKSHGQPVPAQPIGAT